MIDILFIFIIYSAGFTHGYFKSEEDNPQASITCEQLNHKTEK